MQPDHREAQEARRAGPILEALGISKAFLGTQALDNVDFELLSGEVHALVGENGAGKSTLANILSGALRPDSGELRVGSPTNDTLMPVQITSTRRAHELGIGTVFQELSLVPALSVAENVFVNRVPKRAFGLVNWPSLYSGTRALIAPFEVKIDPRTLVRELNVSTKQIVEIVKALSLNARMLILDEPTTALAPYEVDLLFRIIRRLKAKGLGIVFISHRMREVLEIADRVTVLRDGHLVGTYPAQGLTVDTLIRLMVGRELKEMFERGSGAAGDAVLRVEGLSRSGGIESISFSLRRGEIVGLAGLKGAGRFELAQLLAGAERPSAGRIWLEGRAVKFGSPADAVALGIGYLPAERKSDGLFLEMTVRDNIAAARLPRFSRWGLVDVGRENAVALDFVRRLSIRTPSVQQIVRRLSGGNQQKVMLSRWLVTPPKVLIVDEPTRGVDVGAKIEIHRLLRELAQRGMSILFISSDLPEVLGLSDRILVMHEGRLTGELNADEATEEKVIALASEDVKRGT